MYCVDDRDHTVRKFTLDGRLVQTLGVSGIASDTGYVDTGHLNSDLNGIKVSAGPFNRPTAAAVTRTGDIYVSDGYGNARVHCFGSDGGLKFSWGAPGGGPGEFKLPHSLIVMKRPGHMDEEVMVADRENQRIQIFTLGGEYVEEIQGVHRPNGICVTEVPTWLLLVVELGDPAGVEDRVYARCSAFDANGHVVLRWGGSPDAGASGSFLAAHGICSDSRGDVYVTEVNETAGGPAGLSYAAEVPPRANRRDGVNLFADSQHGGALGAGFAPGLVVR